MSRGVQTSPADRRLGLWQAEVGLLPRGSAVLSAEKSFDQEMA
jgi:hypothetical protein